MCGHFRIPLQVDLCRWVQCVSRKFESNENFLECCWNQCRLAICHFESTHPLSSVQYHSWNSQTCCNLTLLHSSCDRLCLLRGAGPAGSVGAVFVGVGGVVGCRQRLRSGPKAALQLIKKPAGVHGFVVCRYTGP